MKKTTYTTLLSVSLVFGMAFLQGCDDDNSFSGTSPQQPDPDLWPPYNLDGFPIIVENSLADWGQLEFDSSGNLLVVGGDSTVITIVDRSDNSLSTIAPDPISATDIVSIVDPGGDVYYIGMGNGCCDGELYSVDKVSGAATLIMDIDWSINGLKVAPEGYGDYGGQLIAATVNSGIRALDPLTAASVAIGAGTGDYSDLEFAADGTLYAAKYGSAQIVTMAADGTEVVINNTINGPDGIAVDNFRGMLYVASSVTDDLYTVDPADGTATPIGEYNFNGGYYPSGLAYDEDNDVLFVMDADPITFKQRISAQPAPPEPMP